MRKPYFFFAVVGDAGPHLRGTEWPQGRVSGPTGGLRFLFYLTIRIRSGFSPVGGLT